MLDLHTHSRASDGSDTPERIPELALEAGCSAVALTDHDTLDGLAPAGRRATELGIKLVRGCEVSCAWERGSMHVLIYFIDRADTPIEAELANLRADRVVRNERMLKKLRDIGISLTMDEISREAGGKGVGRPHFARVLVGKGVVATPKEAFERFLGAGMPAYVSKARLKPAEVASLAKQSGAVTVLAHPLSLGLTMDEIAAIAAELAEKGFTGIEALYSSYSDQERRSLCEIAARCDLAITGGSDYHGSYKPDLKIGTGRGDLDVPDSLLHALEERRP